MKAEQGVAIRPMHIRDIRFVHALEQSTFGKSFGESMLYEEIINNQAAHYALMTNDNERIGYIGLRRLDKGAEITTIALREEDRGKGFGTVLLKYGETVCKRWGVLTLTLEVRPSNKVAHAFYKRHGFHVSATRKNYYNDGEDAYLMTKQLGGEHDDRTRNRKQL